VKYKILIKKCEDPQRASAIAAEVARWSGSTPDVVYNAITQKAICIRKEADEDEAHRLSAQFGGIGAEVELVPIQEGPPAAAAAFAAAPAGVAAAAAPYAAAAPATSTVAARDDDDDEEDDEPGRILTDAEYAEMVKSRPDVFYFEKSGKMRNIQLICMIMAIISIIVISNHVPVQVATDFFEKLPEERVAKLVRADEIQAQLEEKKKEEKKEEVPTDVKKLKPTQNKGAGGMTGGGGDPRARVTQMGVLGIVSGQIKGKSVASADIFGKGGFASDIDAILSGVGGLRSGGDGGVGRKGVAGIGYGSGYGSGFGGSGGGIDDLLGGLMGGGGGGGLDLKKRGELRVSSPDFLKGGALTGGRSRASIQRVVMQNMAALRHAYSRRLRDKPGLSGTVTVKFSIDEFGKVIFAQMVSSTLNDSELEQTVVTRVRSWVFERIDKPGDVTEVTYPFTFTQ
jgi:TonB family protein